MIPWNVPMYRLSTNPEYLLLLLLLLLLSYSAVFIVADVIIDKEPVIYIILGFRFVDYF